MVRLFFWRQQQQDRTNNSASLSPSQRSQSLSPSQQQQQTSTSSSPSTPSRPNRPRLSSREYVAGRPRARTSSSSGTGDDSASSLPSYPTTTTAIHSTTSTPIGHTTTNPSRRRRLNSRDYAQRSYSGMYGSNQDLLPFEMNRQRSSLLFFSSNSSILWLIACYATIVAFLQMTSLFFFPPYMSWTATNAMHCAVTLIYIHWLKGTGSFLFGDEQGEMKAMTVWEQLEAAAGAASACEGGCCNCSGGGCSSSTRAIRRLLLVVPTILTYGACHFANYNPPSLCLVNAVFWMISMLAKLPMMNGVRIFGINRTVGIDDCSEGEDDDDVVPLNRFNDDDLFHDIHPTGSGGDHHVGGLLQQLGEESEFYILQTNPSDTPTAPAPCTASSNHDSLRERDVTLNGAAVVPQSLTFTTLATAATNKQKTL